MLNEGINEGIVVNDTKTVLKSEMVRQLQQLGPTTPDTWERAVFETLTNGRREDVDWDVEDNQAGYFLWLRSFDDLIEELVRDGYVRVEDSGPRGERTLIPVEVDPGIDYSQLVYPRLE